MITGEAKHKAGERRMQARTRIVAAVFAALFCVVAVRLVVLSVRAERQADGVLSEVSDAPIPRPAIVDRNGRVLATDLEVASLFAEPRRIIDPDEAVELLTAHLPDLDAQQLRDKLTSDRGFVWIRRELGPREQEMIHNLGIPGLGFRAEQRRIYPNGHAAAHVLGFVDVDSRGISGIEKYLDDGGSLYVASLADPDRPAAAPVELALDLRAQHALFDELQAAMERFQSIAAAGVVIDVHTGEVVASVSLPDFNPNDPSTSLDAATNDRITAGVFELGSTFKTVTVAMALDSGVTTLQGSYDATHALRVGGFRIDDFHAKHRVLTVPEVFIYSSNIGSAKMALDVGLDGHMEFLRRLGFTERLRTELPTAAPLIPARWSQISSITAAFGHGISVTPLQLATATAAIVNGGFYIEPTFLRRDREVAMSLARRVIQPQTSEALVQLLMLNVSSGTARQARVDGYAVGGKTGTAEKVVNGRYSNTAVLTSFLGMFPGYDPQYVLLLMLDEPKPAEGTYGYRTAGYNAVPTAGRVIGRIAPLLGIAPRSEEELRTLVPVLVSAGH
jgi:cell division protein FtsI (penicillin-binding protein 3)